MEEIWKEVPGYEGCYQVSNLGNVKSFKYKNGRLLKPRLSTEGYLRVTLCKAGKLKQIGVHQLVAITFLNHELCGYKLVVNHINHIRKDNRLENLEVITQRENVSKRNIIGTSRFTGVAWNTEREKWTASIKINGSTKQLGYFDDEEEASEYYKKAVISLNKEEEIEVKSATFSSKYRGVTWNEKNKNWMSRVSINGKIKYLGSYNTEEEANKICENFKASS